MNKVSKGNLYYDSQGKGYTQEEINIRINKAKQEVKENYLDNYGYLFCTKCFKNSCVPIDMAHMISIKKAKEMRKTELCWNIDNIKPRGRKCHNILDKTY